MPNLHAYSEEALTGAGPHCSAFNSPRVRPSPRCYNPVPVGKFLAKFPLRANEISEAPQDTSPMSQVLAQGLSLWLVERTG